MKLDVSIRLPNQATVRQMFIASVDGLPGQGPARCIGAEKEVIAKQSKQVSMRSRINSFRDEKKPELEEKINDW